MRISSKSWLHLKTRIIVHYNWKTVWAEGGHFPKVVDPVLPLVVHSHISCTHNSCKPRQLNWKKLSTEASCQSLRTNKQTKVLQSTLSILQVIRLTTYNFTCFALVLKSIGLSELETTSSKHRKDHVNHFKEGTHRAVSLLRKEIRSLFLNPVDSTKILVCTSWSVDS
jgi:hypothetical protein